MTNVLSRRNSLPSIQELEVEESPETTPVAAAIAANTQEVARVMGHESTRGSSGGRTKIILDAPSAGIASSGFLVWEEEHTGNATERANESKTVLESTSHLNMPARLPGDIYQDTKIR